MTRRPLSRLAIEQRPVLDSLIETMADPQRSRLLSERLHELALDPLRDQDPVHRDTDLPHVRIAAPYRRRHDHLEIGVVEHDQWRLPAQLQRQTLDMPRCQLHHPPPRRGRARDRHLAA